MNGRVLVIFNNLRLRMIDRGAFALGKFAINQDIVAHLEVAGNVGDIPPPTGDLAGIVLEHKLEQRAAAAEAFQKTLRFLGVGDANMEEGSLRVDVNVSVRRRGDGGDDGAALGERCEVKNLNSFRSIASAVRFEARRHRELIARGENVERETRSFDPANGETAPLRRVLYTGPHTTALAW